MADDEFRYEKPVVISSQQLTPQEEEEIKRIAEERLAEARALIHGEAPTLADVVADVVADAVTEDITQKEFITPEDLRRIDEEEKQARREEINRRRVSGARRKDATNRFYSILQRVYLPEAELVGVFDLEEQETTYLMEKKQAFEELVADIKRIMIGAFCDALPMIGDGRSSVAIKDALTTIEDSKEDFCRQFKMNYTFLDGLISKEFVKEAERTQENLIRRRKRLAIARAAERAISNTPDTPIKSSQKKKRVPLHWDGKDE